MCGIKNIHSTLHLPKTCACFLCFPALNVQYSACTVATYICTVQIQVRLMIGWQAISQDLKSGCPKCVIGPAQISNL